MSMLGWGATPMVTPKFDPRLPFTPASKRPATQEENVMSMAGSPISVDRKTVRSLLFFGPYIFQV